MFRDGRLQPEGYFMVVKKKMGNVRAKCPTYLEMQFIFVFFFLYVQVLSELHAVLLPKNAYQASSNNPLALFLI